MSDTKNLLASTSDAPANEAITIRAGIEPISKQMARKKWTWLSHVLKMDHRLHSRIALPSVPESVRVDRKRHRVVQYVERELKERGLKS